MSNLVYKVGQLNGQWGVFEVKANGSMVCATDRLYPTEYEALVAFGKRQEKLS